MHRLKHLLFSLFLLVGTTLIAQEDCMPKTSNRLVNDYAQALQPNQANQLEAKLRQFNDSTSNQIVVVITNELCNLEPMEYATEIGHSWGVGQKEFDNGVVLLVSPEQRETFIAVGYGLEGAIPDAIAKRIVENELLPHFREGDYYGGIDAATGVLAQLAKGEISAEGYGARTNSKGDAPLGVIGLVIFLGIIFMVVGPILSARKYADTNDVAFWTALMLIMSSRNSHGGMFGNFSSGSGSFGGGGGGFGGFGGGGFGGGGAGGSW